MSTIKENKELANEITKAIKKLESYLSAKDYESFLNHFIESDIISEVNPTNLILWGFIWEDTEEGSDYWFNIHSSICEKLAYDSHLEVGV